MKTKEDAISLSKAMMDIGTLTNIETVCVITNMEEPIGSAVGNSLEIIETVECLKNKMPDDIKEIVLELGAQILKLYYGTDNMEENKAKVLEAIENGSAYSKFLELVNKQGGDASYIENIGKFEKAEYIVPVVSKKSGYVKELNAGEIGEISVFLGAGRIKKEDKIDNKVGIIINKKISDKVEQGEVLAYVHASEKEKADVAAEKVADAYKIVEEKVEKPKQILEVLY
jgi:pyrimidine-nucleoside phosphorylase